MSETQPSTSTTVVAHGLQWRAVQDFADVLPQIDVFRLRDVDNLGSWELIKDNNHRTVVRVPDPTGAKGPDLYVKRYKLSKLTRRLKHLVRPTHAAKEWAVSQALQERDIPTCRVLAVAERRPGLLHREAFLINREIPNAVPVSDYLEQNEWSQLPLGWRCALIDELATLTARMIARGVRHDDMHMGNVMIKPDAPAGERLFVLDLHRVRVGRVGRRGVVRMMVYLADSTEKRGVGSRDRLRFLRRVLELWKGEGWLTRDRLRGWDERVRKAWGKHRRRHMRSRTKRCLVDSTEFCPDASNHFKVHRRRNFPLDTALKAISGHESAMAGVGSGNRVVKDGTRTAVTWCQDAAGDRIFVKAFRRGPMVERVKDLFRFRSRARKAWIAHRAFRIRDVPAAPGLCLLEAKNKLNGHPDYLLTRDPGAMADLQVLAQAQSSEHPRHENLVLSDRQRRQLSASVADLFTTMANNRVRHRDMKPSNVLVREEQGQFHFWLVDMDRARVEVDWTRRLWVYHLAQCNAGLDDGITLLDRMRSLREIGKGRWTDDERLSIARDVLKMSLDRNPMWLRKGDGKS